jgi:N-acetylglucosaminyl-diphospho-decaprenol L-rhamnosyltransferase
MSDTTLPNHIQRLVIVILNYRTADLTIDCLHSLVAEVQSRSGMQVVVSDNDSQDGSVERIGAAIATEGWGDWVTLMPLERNGGYAFGNNAVLRQALESPDPSPYYLLLNPDTIVRPGAIKALVDFLENHPEIGIVGSRLEDPDGTPQISAFRFPSLWTELDFGLRIGLVTQLLSRWTLAPAVVDQPCQTDWVAGASMLIRREVFEAIGLLDETYFMYFEEVDFCLQAQRAGWPCWYLPESRVVHLVGQSSGVTDTKRPPKRLPTYWFNSRRYYFLKNHGWFYTVLTDAVFMTGLSLLNLRRMIQRKPNTDPPQLLSDFFLNSVFLKGGQG